MSKVKVKKVKAPIVMYKIVCAECGKEMGLVVRVPVFQVQDDKVINSKQPYEHALFKSRKEGITFFDTRTFCSKKCKAKFLDKYYKEEREYET